MVGKSFSNRVKNELARLEFDKECCCLAEFSAFLRARGILRISNKNQFSLYIATNNAAVARRIFRLGKKIYDCPVELMVRRRRCLQKENQYLVEMMIPSSHKRHIVYTLGIVQGKKVLEGIKASLVRRQCCRRAYLRGVFLGCGSVTNPNSEYHLEMVLTDAGYARHLVKLLSRVGIRAGINQRKNHYVVYIKDADQIADFFSIIGAHGALLSFEDTRVRKEMRNQINRLVNCDTANVKKTVSAGLRQVENIKIIAAVKGLEWLPSALKQIAVLRLEYPEASLKELGELMEPRLSKSGVNHRLRQLEEIANQLQRQ